MTVILGVNLSDRLYIAGDTRVSNLVNGKVVPHHDDVQKVEHLKNGIIIASAGHLGLASHIVSRLRKTTFVDLGIDATRRNIESWIGPEVDYYWQNQGSSSAHATFIIGGSANRKRVLKAYQLRKMQEDLFANEEARRQSIGINTILFNAMKNPRDMNEPLKLNCRDTVLFSVSVSHAGISIKDTEWGEFLLYGSPGLTKEDISSSDIARLEFSQHPPGKDNGAMLITAFTSQMVEKRKLEGVGPTVLVGAVRSKDSYLITGAVYSVEEEQSQNSPFTFVERSNVEVINDVIHRIDNGTKYPLTPVSKYKSDDVASLYL